MRLSPSAHVDTFCRDHLPPPDQWPELRFDLPELQLPRAAQLRRRAARRTVARARRRPALPAAPPTETWTYGELLAPGQPGRPRAHRGPRPRARATGCCCAARTTRGSSPAGSACSRPAASSSPPCRCCAPASSPRIVEIARADLALCDHRFVDDLAAAAPAAARSSRTAATAADDLDRRAARPSPATFDAVDTAADDVALLAFTSGTTGRPEGDHALPPRRAGHRRHVLARTCSSRTPDDVFTGTPAARRSPSGSAGCWSSRCAPAPRRC